MAKIIFNGDEGEAFTNESDRVLYQFHASLSNTCGSCLQLHMAISSFWPIPIHRGCNCTQTLVKPGATAAPWVDYRKILDEMPPDQKRAAVGASNYRLLKRGVVTWDDVVTSTRVRSFREVVARGRFSLDDLLRFGVGAVAAKAAWTSVHTTGHEAAALHRKSLIDNLSKAGLTRDQIREGFAKSAASRVSLIDIPPPKGPTTPATPVPVEPLIELLNLDADKVKAALKKAEEERKRREEEEEDS